MSHRARIIDPAKFRREAAYAEMIYDLQTTAANSTDAGLVMVGFDSIIFENYRNLENALMWFEGAHPQWLRNNMEYAEKTGHSVMVRLIILPYPTALKTSFLRRRLREFIVLNLHLHLWHGVLCCVKFFDPLRVSASQMAQALGFFTFPKMRRFYDLPDFNKSEHARKSIVQGSGYEESYRRVRDWVARERDWIWLFYDEQHFERSRMSGWHWHQLRSFFTELMRGDLLCPECRKRVADQLDHIGPVAEQYLQTVLNFQLLCGVCNRRKSDTTVTDPFQLRYPLPNQLNSLTLQRVLREPPPWLGKLPRPTSRPHELFKIAGL